MEQPQKYESIVVQFGACMRQNHSIKSLLWATFFRVSFVCLDKSQPYPHKSNKTCDQANKNSRPINLGLHCGFPGVALGILLLLLVHGPFSGSTSWFIIVYRLWLLAGFHPTIINWYILIRKIHHHSAGQHSTSWANRSPPLTKHYPINHQPLAVNCKRNFNQPISNTWWFQNGVPPVFIHEPFIVTHQPLLDIVRISPIYHGLLSPCLQPLLTIVTPN